MLVKEDVEVIVNNAAGLSIGLASNVPSAICFADKEAGFLDEGFEVLAVAAETLEGSSVPHVLEVSEPD